MKELILQGILADQDGQDTIEYVAIASVIIMIALGAFAIIRNIVMEGARRITW